ncbi:MAG: DNA mismatch repair endonuclease MutL, partial [Chloroflexota bacterium]|nr:DNA mismatch repair endonuclease MutL [Chloroflexota bacterium]
ENSIDAGAKEIKIEVRQGGKRLVRVIDDGVGISADEVELAFARYSTSKLATADDLSRITTLGFRGEALASIAAVAQVTLVTRTADEAMGTLIRLEGSKVTQRGKTGCPEGAVVTVENLFYNVPARMKFLHSTATERKHVFRLVTRYAMAYPGLRFSLLSDGHMAFRSTGGGDLYDVLIEVYGLDVARQMLQVASGKSQIAVNGYIGVPSLHRANRAHLTLFVNHRWVQSRMLAYAVEEAYHTLLPQGRHPLVVLNIELDPSLVDVNVHPTKREVKFLPRDRVFTTVQRAVRHTLIEGAPIPTIETPPVQGWERRTRLVEVGKGRLSRAEMALEVQRPAEEHPMAGLGGKLPPLRVLGQMAQTYIIAEGPDGMYLVDQHAAHERILYEQLRAAQEQKGIISQALLEPLTVELSSQQGAAIEENLDALAKLGFEIEPFGGQTYLVRAVPAVLKEGDVGEALREVLDNLAAGRREDWREKALMSIACHGAIRAGKTLTEEEMRELIKQLEAADMPRTCPHGRPTMVRLSRAQLESEFGRR